jgi:hypothetical protein
LVADPKAKKRVTEKRLIFAGQKNSLLALHTASLELDSELLVKSRKIDRKIDFFRKFLNNKKILGLKGVLNGFLIQVRDIITAPNSLRKDPKCISVLIIEKIFLKILEFFQIFSKYFFEK